MNKQLKTIGLLAIATPIFLANAAPNPSEKNKRIFDHWQPERIKNATPRDLIIDAKGNGYLRGKQGNLIPHGHDKKAEAVATQAAEVNAANYIVTNSGWDNGGLVQQTAGRIYFEMPQRRNLRRWDGYVCSGTVATESVTGRSIIITAAHCVYDDVNKAFARNVLFIPNQDGTTGSGTDTNCNNDPVGCWTTSFGVVDTNWTTGRFPNNAAWDYAYYVVNDSGAHSGAAASSDALDQAVGSLDISFSQPYYNDNDDSATSLDFTHGLGYSYSDDPNFMYCAEDMTTEGSDNWWLPSCGLSGGSSGGPWIQGMNESTGTGTIMSVNSWGYNGSPGMAGPILSGTSAECMFIEAQDTAFSAVSTADGQAGVVSSCQ